MEQVDIQIDGRAVQRDVALAFEYAHYEDEWVTWVTPLTDALAGLTAREAAWKPETGDADMRSIWEIVLHMTAWTDNVVERLAQRLRSEPMGRPAEGNWPTLPDTHDDAAWEEAKQRLWESLAGLRAHIETTPPAAMLDQGTVGYSQFADLLCRFIHNAYHIGQITKLREWREWQSRQGTGT
jgi:hypothetical protein